MWLYEDLCVKEHYFFKVSIHIWVYGDITSQELGCLQGKHTYLGLWRDYVQTQDKHTYLGLWRVCV